MCVCVCVCVCMCVYMCVYVCVCVCVYVCFVQVSMVQTSKTDHFCCAQQKWCNLNLLHAMVIKILGNQQKLLFFRNT